MSLTLNRCPGTSSFPPPRVWKIGNVLFGLLLATEDDDDDMSAGKAAASPPPAAQSERPPSRKSRLEGLPEGPGERSQRRHFSNSSRYEAFPKRSTAPRRRIISFEKIPPFKREDRLAAGGGAGGALTDKINLHGCALNSVKNLIVI